MEKMIQPKVEYLDTIICCPATKKEVQVRFIDKELYQYYYNNGYDFIFENSILKLYEEVKIIQNKKPNKNDIS